MQIHYRYPKKNEEIPAGKAIIRFEENDLIRVSTVPSGTEISIGVSAFKSISRRKLITLIRKSIRTAKEHKCGEIVLDLKSLHFKGAKRIDDFDLGTLLGENAEMANFEFLRFKDQSSPSIPTRISEITVLNSTPALVKGIAKGQIIGEEVNASRTLANTPASDMTPSILAAEAKKATSGTAISTTILDREEIEKLSMGAIIAVAKGSSESPQFIVMEYWGGPKNQKPIVFVGKGVTFDTGGINIKPEDHSLGMHLDMSGGAAVIHAIVAIAKLRMKKNVIALIPAVENMVSGSSYRPGDIIHSMSGKTIEVINTDAEGRLILADALTYAEKYQPRLVVDVATLTGSALGTLGEKASAIMTPDEKIEREMRRVGEISGEYVWPLPLWDEYEDGVKGVFADFANLPTKGNTRYAGAIMGGMFLYQFAKKYSWVHIDMAPRMESTDGDELAKGSAGSPVRLLVRLAETF